MLRDLYTASIDSLMVADVEAFLTALDGLLGMTFEVLGDGMTPTERLTPGAVARAVCGFANSRLGGVLVIGAAEDRSRRVVELRGLQQPPRGPLGEWLDHVIRTSIQPVPVCEVRTFRASAVRGPVAVVRVRPHALKPALHAGRILVRTSSGARQLDDPAEIGRLFRESEGAIALAVERVMRPVAPTPDREAVARRPSSAPGIRLGLAPIAVPGDFSSTMYRQAYVDATLPGHLQSRFGAGGSSAALARMRGSSVISWIDPSEVIEVRVHEDGLATVTTWPDVLYGCTVALAQLQERFDPLVDVLVAALRSLGAAGPAVLRGQVFCKGQEAGAYRVLDDLGRPDEAAAALLRSLTRGLGRQVYEPDERRLEP